MRTTPPEPSLPPPDAAPDPQWRRANKRHALAIVVLIHIALLMALMLSRARQPTPPPKKSSIDVALLQEKVPEKIPETKPAEMKPFDLPPEHLIQMVYQPTRTPYGFRAVWVAPDLWRFVD